MTVDIQLSWDFSPSPSGEIDGYRIYQTDVLNPTFPADYTQIDVVGRSTALYYDYGVAENTTFTYAVTAYNSAGESTPTTDTVDTTLSAPTNLTVTDDTIENELTLDWDGVSNAAGYYVYRAESSGSSKSDYTQVADVTSPPYTDTALEDGERYYYRVSSHN